MQKLLLALSLILPVVSQAAPATPCSAELVATGGDNASLSCSGDLPQQNSVSSSDAIELNGTTYIFSDASSHAARAHGVFLRQDYALPLNNSVLLGVWDIRDESIDKTPLSILGRSFNITTNPGATNLGATNPISGAKLLTGSGSGILVQLPDYFPTIGGTLVLGGSDSVHLVTAAKPAMGVMGFYDNGWVVISVVPEPSSYATLLLGLAAVGWVSRKRC